MQWKCFGKLCIFYFTCIVCTPATGPIFGKKNCAYYIRVQALADISRSAPCCHSNETCALTANLPNTAQLGGNPYHSHKLYPDPCSSVGMRQGTDRRTDKQTHITNIHFTSLRLTRNVIIGDNGSAMQVCLYAQIRQLYRADFATGFYNNIILQRPATYGSVPRRLHC